MSTVASRQKQHPIGWGVALIWVGVLLACLGFWFGVGYGLNVAWHAIWPNPKPAPPPTYPRHDQIGSGFVCNESSPPLPQIGTAIVCYRA